MHPAERHIILLLRLLMAWTFLYSASHQVLVPNFSVVGFMNSTKRFHGLFVLFTPPTLAPDCQFPRRVGAYADRPIAAAPGVSGRHRSVRQLS